MRRSEESLKHCGRKKDIALCIARKDGLDRRTAWRASALMRLHLKTAMSENIEAPGAITDTIVEIKVGIAHIGARVILQSIVVEIVIHLIKMTDVCSKQWRGHLMRSVNALNVYTGLLYNTSFPSFRYEFTRES